VKIGRCEVAERSSGLQHKKFALRGTRPSPHLPKMDWSRPKFPEHCHPWHVDVDRIWSGSAVLCRTYSGKIDFSTTKSIQYRLSTYKNDMHIQLSLSLHFYLLYLLLNSCDGNDAFWCHSMLVKQYSSFHRKHRTLSLLICVCHTVRTLVVDWLQNFAIDANMKTSLWKSAKLKLVLFRANTPHNRLSSEVQSDRQSTDENTSFCVISAAAI